MSNFIHRSSAPLLFLVTSLITLYIAYPVGTWQMMGWFLSGNLISGMFVEMHDPNQWTWLFAKTGGILVGAGIPVTIENILIYVGAWLPVGLIVAMGSLGYTLLHLGLCRTFYGKILPNRSIRYIKWTFFLNALLVLSFLGIGFQEFINSPSISLFSPWYGSGFLIVVCLTFFVTWWGQHILNQYVCGLQSYYETK